jgi:CRP-like cAMP-binding protein
MYFVAKGSVHILDEKNTIISKLEPKSFFGDEALFNNLERTYNAICTEKSILLTLTKNNLLNVLSECPSVAIELLCIYAKKLPNNN